MSSPPSNGGRPVVVGVDGSDSSIQAALYAAEEARRRGRPLLLVHATPWSVSDPMDPLAVAGFGRLLEDSAEDLLRAAEAAIRERVDAAPGIRTAVLDEHPVPALSRISAEAAVLVLGRRGVSGVTGVLAGSTASGVVQHARCPVVVLPEDDQGDPRGRRGIVVAVEGAPEDEHVLAFAVAEAAARGTDLVALHAWRDRVLEASVGGFGSFADWSGVESDEQRLVAEAVAGWRAGEPDLEIREVVVRDRPVPALREAAASAELLVVGHRHRPALARLGSTVHGLLHRAPCPLAVVPLLRTGE
jgi:nucleotide-binding universal stress UspA family protein